MYALYFLGLLAAVAMYMVTGDDQVVHAEGKIENRAAQMLVYHEGAADYCDIPGNCGSASAISAANVRSTMSPVVSGAVAYNDGRFRSFTDGAGTVITISADHNFNNANNSSNVEGTTKMVQERSKIAVKLTQMAGTDRPAGRYDRASGTITSYDGTVINVPGSIGGTTFANDVPMIAEN